MKEYWDHLRPLEKRLVVGVAAVMFLVLNAWFVVPHFKDWGEANLRIAKAQRTLKAFQDEIAQVPNFEAKVRAMETEGQAVPPEDMSIHMQDTIRRQAEQTGVGLLNVGTVKTSTNDAFFVEKTEVLSAASKEQPLVDFLYNLGQGNSLIRVRSLGLKADPSHQQLQASITLVASYQKKQPPKTSTLPAKSSGPPSASSTSAARPGVQQPAPATKSGLPPAKPPVLPPKPGTPPNKKS